MQKKALFQYCQQLAIQISAITEFTDGQIINIVKESKQGVLPPVSSIFENKDLMKKINLIKAHTNTLRKVSSQTLVKKKVPSTLKQIYKQKTEDELRQPRSGSQTQRCHHSKRRLLE
jgi:hypothetical protein